MNKLWVCSDLRLGEQNQAELFQCWNDCVFDDDVVFLLGNIAITNKSFWFSEIQKLQGRKVLFLGDLETNRPNWYEKFDFETIVPFNQTRILKYKHGNIMLSHLPAYESVQVSYEPNKYLGLIKKFNREFDGSSCIVNLHGHTQGKAVERNNTIDVGSVRNLLLTLEQFVETKHDN